MTLHVQTGQVCGGGSYKAPFPGNELGLSLTWGRQHWFGVEVQVCHSLGIVPNSRRVRWAFLLGFTKLFGILWYKIVSVDILAYNSVFRLWGAKVYYLKPGVFYPLPLYWVSILAVHIFSVCWCSIVVHYLKHWVVRSFRKIKKDRMVEKDSKVVPDWRIWREMGERTKYPSEKWQGLWGPRSMKSPISDAWDRWVSTGLLSMGHSWDPVWTAIEAISFRANSGTGNNGAGVQLCRSSSSGNHYWFCHV